MVPKTQAIEINATIFPPVANFPDIASLINTIIPNIFVIGGVVFLIMFVIAGFNFITKAGKVDAAEFEKIRNIMSAAVAGLVIMFIAYWIVRIIQIITGVNITNPAIP